MAHHPPVYRKYPFDILNRLPYTPAVKKQYLIHELFVIDTRITGTKLAINEYQEYGFSFGYAKVAISYPLSYPFDKSCGYAQRGITLDEMKNTVLNPQSTGEDKFDESLNHFIGFANNRFLRVIGKW